MEVQGFRVYGLKKKAQGLRVLRFREFGGPAVLADVLQAPRLVYACERLLPAALAHLSHRTTQVLLSHWLEY